ncbi:phospholipid-transporting ATPase VB-like [Ornithodoros turicata]
MASAEGASLGSLSTIEQTEGFCARWGRRLRCWGRNFRRRRSKRGAGPPPNRIVVPNHLAGSTEELPNKGSAGNGIQTTKYTLLSFLPRNLFEQFHRFANLYFLGIVLLNWVPQINAFGKEVAMIPVLFVLGVTAIKDAFEDHRRYISDKRVNNSTCRVYNKECGRYMKTLWKHVRVGDIVHLSCNEVIPADILLLRSSDEQGLCYIETANLDGETNLKQRQVARGYAEQRETFHPLSFKSTVECDAPNCKIYRFHGFICHPDNAKVPVSSENLLLRDCVLKNADYIEGIVLYAGFETKAMLNNSGPRYKRSRLERFMNRDIIWCIVILLFLCSFGALGSALWLKSYEFRKDVIFIAYEQESARYNPAIEGFIAFWTYIIILQVMIPLSLYVSIEIIKLGQVYHIHEDIELFDERSNRRLECRALNIPEELGQVEYIFSDKTGTLTENNMVFRRCTIGGTDYNHHHPSIGEEMNNVRVDRCNYYSKPSKDDTAFTLNPHLQKELSHLDYQLRTDSAASEVYLTRESQRIQDFFLLMATCNTVIVSKYPHKDLMNASGLYLNNGVSSLSPERRRSARNQLLPPGAAASPSPAASRCSTPTRPNRLALAFFGGRTTPPQRTPTPTPGGELQPIYEAESPDEIALVDAASRYGCRLLRRTPDSVVLTLPGEGLIEFRVLHVLPFDSVRKRMSIVLQHPITKQKVLYCKGADSAILPLLAPTKDKEMQQVILRTQHHLNQYSKKGLRVLCMAKKLLSDEEYEEWLQQHKASEISLKDTDEKLAVSAGLLETDLELLGATGIEDRLQEGVPETIAALRSAGIVVWVLTGDKQETAVNIAYSCKLFSSDMEVITLNARSQEATDETIRFYLEQVERDMTCFDEESSSSVSSYFSSAVAYFCGLFFWKWKKKKHEDEDDAVGRRIGTSFRQKRKRALVIDGRTLSYVLERKADRLFLRLAQQCSVVLCCRATPLQKASVVKMVKDRLNVLTLAIGDGANDVSMIQAADIGLGISGQEGMQAVMASDFALARFRYLERLLLVHGHWCYDRLARAVLYFFYKNAAFIFILFWYQLYCGFTGAVMIDQLYLMLYNVLFTSLPPLVLGIYDQDCPAHLLLKRPALYTPGRKSKTYTRYSFWINMLDALYQSIIIFFVPFLVYYDSDIDIWEFGTTICTACFCVQMLHVAVECKSWTLMHMMSILVSCLVYFGFALMYNSLCYDSPTLQNPYWVMQHAMNNSQFWFCLLLIPVISCLPRFVVRALQASLTPNDILLTLVEEKMRKRSRDSTRSMAWSQESAAVVFRSASPLRDEVATLSVQCCTTQGGGGGVRPRSRDVPPEALVT